MKKIKLIIAALLVAVLANSCIGSFTLSKRTLGWNRNINNKFVNELVFVAFWIIPVYEVCGLADMLVLNSIEFWGGTNPMEKATSTRTVKGSDGISYRVEDKTDGYDIVSLLDGSTTQLRYNTDKQEWTVCGSDGVSHTLFSWVDKDHIRLPLGDTGRWYNVEVSERGLMAYQTIALRTSERMLAAESCLATAEDGFPGSSSSRLAMTGF